MAGFFLATNQVYGWKRLNGTEAFVSGISGEELGSMFRSIEVTLPTNVMGRIGLTRLQVWSGVAPNATKKSTGITEDKET